MDIKNALKLLEQAINNPDILNIKNNTIDANKIIEMYKNKKNNLEFTNKSENKNNSEFTNKSENKNSSEFTNKSENKNSSEFINRSESISNQNDYSTDTYYSGENDTITFTENTIPSEFYNQSESSIKSYCDVADRNMEESYFNTTDTCHIVDFEKSS